MPDTLAAKQQRIRSVLRLERPDRLPCGDLAWAEYRPDVYHLEEPDVVEALGDVRVSANGKRRYTRDGGTWDVGDLERFRDHEDVLGVDLSEFEVEVVCPGMLTEMARLMAEASERGYAAPLHYGTLVTRATLEFGWVPFLTASALDPERFGRIIDRFGEATLAVVRGWLATQGTELVVIHDDIAGTRSVLMSPDWYRQFVFPWYERLFGAIHSAGRKVLYMSDGNYQPVLDDILAAGADGLYIESSSMAPRPFMEQAGRDKLYLLKTSNQNMDVGTPEDIRAELAGLRDLHAQYPGLMMYSGGGNAPPENREAFSRYYQEYLVYE